MKHDWEYKKLGEVCEIINGKNQRNVESSDGEYPIMGSGGVMGYAKDYLCNAGTTIIGRKGTINRPIFVEEKFWNVDTAFGIQPKEGVSCKFIFYVCKSIDFTRYDKSVTIPSLVKSDLLKIPIPVPPLPIQQQIVAELDKVSEIIEKKKQQVKELDNLAQSIFYDMFGEILEATPTKCLKDVAEYFIGLTYSPSDVSENGYIVLRSSNIQNSDLDFEDTVRVNMKISEKKFVHNGDILMCARNGSARLVGKVARINNLQETMSFGAFMTIIRSQYNDYLFHFFLSHFFRGQLTTSKTATINQITTKMLDGIKLNVPTIEQQQSFAQKVEAIEKQKELINQSIKEVQLLFDARMDYWFGE